MLCFMFAKEKLTEVDMVGVGWASSRQLRMVVDEKEERKKKKKKDDKRCMIAAWEVQLCWVGDSEVLGVLQGDPQVTMGVMIRENTQVAEAQWTHTRCTQLEPSAILSAH